MQGGMGRGLGGPCSWKNIMGQIKKLSFQSCLQQKERLDILRCCLWISYQKDTFEPFTRLLQLIKIVFNCVCWSGGVVVCFFKKNSVL